MLKYNIFLGSSYENITKQEMVNPAVYLKKT